MKALAGFDTGRRIQATESLYRFRHGVSIHLDSPSLLFYLETANRTFGRHRTLSGVYPLNHPVEPGPSGRTWSHQTMSHFSPKTVRFQVSALFLILLLSPFLFARWLDRASDETGTERYGFYLTDATAETGIDFVHLKPTLDPKLDPIMPHLTALGASVSVVDYDNDGWQDLYVTRSRQGSSNALYRNQGDGNFAGSCGGRRPGQRERAGKRCLDGVGLGGLRQRRFRRRVCL